MTSQEFNEYVAVDDGLQTTAGVTDAELCYDQQPAADDVMAEEESDGELSEATDTALGQIDTEGRSTGGGQPPAVTFTTALQSLFDVWSYLEAAGCDNYEHYYKLADQLHAISKQQAVQKTIKDFFKWLALRTLIHVV